MKPILADWFCGGGGATKGYQLEGFYVIGIDIIAQPNYCGDEFINANVLNVEMPECDAIHASPPCQNYCWSTSRHRAKGKTYPALIAAPRKLLIKSGKPYVLEHVPTAPLQNPTYLEGTMFGLGVIRRRSFETNWWLPQPMYRKREKPIMQQSQQDPRIFIQKSAYCSVAGNGADGWSCRVADWRKAMGIDWMTRAEIKQAIPPKYTAYIGKYLMGMVER